MKPTDTTKVPPLVHLAEALVMGSEASIVSEERRGGDEMLRATIVPTDGSEALADIGFELGEVCHGDPIFRNAVTPEGWKRVSANHQYGYWTHIEDEEGFRRVAMFYKAAFYDRSAHVQVVLIPTTQAQDDAFGPIYDEEYEKARSAQSPRLVKQHCRRELHLEQGGRRRMTLKIYEMGDGWGNDIIISTRTVIAAPDGTIESDETVERD